MYRQRYDITDAAHVAEIMALAYSSAAASPDRSNQNGAILLDETGRVIGLGYNHFPPGFELDEAEFVEQEGMTDEEIAAMKARKYKHIEHAERHAIYDAARYSATIDSVLVCPWAACFDCARAIRAAGCHKLIVHQERVILTPPRWQADVQAAIDRLQRTVEVVLLVGAIPVPPGATVQVNGRPWSPATLEFV